MPEQLDVSRPIPFVRTGDPKWAWENERERAAHQQGVFEREYDQYGRPFYNLERQNIRAAEEAYRPIAEGRGGYSPYESNAIQERGRLNQLEYSPEEYLAQFYSPEEVQAILGDPSTAFQYFDPEYLRSLDEQAAGNLRGAYDEGAAGVRSAYEEFLPTGMDPSTAARVRSAVDPALLRIDPRFKNEYIMSDADVEAQAALGAKAGAVPFQAMADEGARHAVASGVVNPLAIAALKERGARRAAISAADNAARARLDAETAQRGQRREYEGMRLGAEQGYSDRAVNSELNLERLRQAAEQYRAGYISENEFRLMQSKLGIESDIADRMIGTGRYTTDVGTGLAQYAEGEGSRRAGQVAGQRVESERYGSGERYGRGMQLSGERSRRAQTVADARRGDEQEYRQFRTGQQAYSGGRAAQEADRRLQGYESTSRNTAQAAQGLTNKPRGFWGSLAGQWLSPGGLFSAAGTAGDGGLVTEPTLLLTGEKGPEMIVPLYPSDPDEFTVNGQKGYRRPQMSDPGDGVSEHPVVAGRERY